MFFELRQYAIRPGKQAEWVDLMETEIIPFQVAQGMVILGSWVGEEDDSVYVWLRRFQDEAERERLYEAVYDSDHWKNVIGPKIPRPDGPGADSGHTDRGDAEVGHPVESAPWAGSARRGRLNLAPGRAGARSPSGAIGAGDALTAFVFTIPIDESTVNADRGTEQKREDPVLDVDVVGAGGLGH